MYLKRIELLGFKSFADKSVIEFKPGITGIVGPNGCGKSNISDAVRWVLGEQSVKSLRGSTMSDVIFAGSEDRKALGLAQVTLVFNNEDHYLHSDYNEIQITRRLYRQNNESEYLINNQLCRLKDIVDLVMDSGLGRDSLSLISQGNISTFADSKPQDRRGMFEEAAGVAKYKKRKGESLRRLDRTEDNLSRIDDICSELERQIGPLKRQKEKAETYLELKNELESIEVNVLVKQIEELSQSLEDIKQSLDKLEKDKLENDNAIIINDQQNEVYKKKMFDLDSEVNDLQSRLLTAMSNLSSLETRKVEIDADRKHLLESNDKAMLEEKIRQLKEMIKESTDEYNNREERYQIVKKERKELEDKQYLLNEQINRLGEEMENVQFQRHRHQTRKEQLVDIIDNRSNYSLGVRSIIKAKNSLNGIVGVLGELLSCDEKYNEALSASLAGASQFIVVKSEEDAKKAISFLRKNHAGRATFLPIDTMSARTIRKEHRLVCDQFSGFLGVLSDFVESNQDLGSIIENQCGNVLVVETIDQASQLSKAVYGRYRVVSLKGDIVNVGGSLTGGRYQQSNTLFASKSELKRVEKQLDEDDKKLQSLKHNRAVLETELREIGESLLQKNVTYARMEVEVANKRGEVELHKSEYESLTHQDLELSQLESGETSNELIDQLNEANKEKDELTEAIQVKRELRMSYVNDSDKLENTLKQQRQASHNMLEEMSQLKVTQAKKQTEMNNYLLRLNDSYKMTYDYACQHYHQEIDMDKALDAVSQLRSRIDALGHVNVEAIDSYKEVSSRYDTLTRQKVDLMNARESLMKAIDEMDDIMVKQFSTTFDQINKEFNNVFRYLFGGGKAALKYSDPDNILETGIDIDVQPPGKAIQNISLFSGGEKALIAISCLFAILKVRPVPMCILDEVEAALDSANVERFAKYLREFSKQTQFIVVTHRTGMMEECDLLYGATMQQKGVTKLVSVKLKDAIDLAGAKEDS